MNGKAWRSKILCQSSSSHVEFEPRFDIRYVGEEDVPDCIILYMPPMDWRVHTKWDTSEHKLHGDSTTWDICLLTDASLNRDKSRSGAQYLCIENLIVIK